MCACMHVNIDIHMCMCVCVHMCDAGLSLRAYARDYVQAPMCVCSICTSLCAQVYICVYVGVSHKFD